jgi:hypothetical protein
VPFSRAAFLVSAKRAWKTLRALWANRATRARAVRQGYIDVPFFVPAGSGRMLMDVFPGGHTRASVFGRRRCSAGRCVVRLTVVAEGVRAYARRPLTLVEDFKTGTGRSTVQTDALLPLRMPFP